MNRIRLQSEGDVYHVVSRGNGRQVIFEDDDDRRFFIRTLHDCWEEMHLELYAWCLMENHFHLLVHGSTSSISRAMKKLCSVYARRFNKRTGRVGHLFQDRFDSEPIDGNSYLLSVVRYIHKNPEKGGVAPMDSYKWSSYHEYFGEPVLCSTSFVLGVFGGLPNFRSFHEEAREGENWSEMWRRGTVKKKEGERRKEAQRAVGAIQLADIKTLSPPIRNQHLVLLKNAGFSIREIERYTGVGRSTVARA